MPNILDIPMKKTAAISISSQDAHAKFTAKKAHVEIVSTLNKGIQINSRYKSEQTSIGINDNYLASVTYRKRTFPIYMILGILFSISGIITLTSSSDDVGIIVGLILLVTGLVLVVLYFYTRIARISFRLADEQDYDVLLSSSAVQDSNLMQAFIQKMLMNAMKVEENIKTISVEDQLQIPETEVHAYQPPVKEQPEIQSAVTQPVVQPQMAPQPVAAQPVAAQPVATQPVAAQPVSAQPVVTQPNIQQDVNWGQ